MRNQPGKPDQRFIDFRFILISLLSGALLLTSSCKEEPRTDRPLRIFAASDLRYAMGEIIQEFSLLHPDARIEAIYGSSGKAYSTIMNGAPYDIYFSANMDYPRKLKEKGLVSGEIIRYAQGYIVLWQKKGGKADFSARSYSLTSPEIRTIAIANPDHAPYGRAAKEFLQSQNLWEPLQSKLVIGENIAQAAQFAATGGADVGILAYSLAMAPDMLQIEGSSLRIDPSLHNPLDQAFVITEYGASHPYSRKFADFVKSDAAGAIMKNYGFGVPEKP